ncbi:MAG: endonuclease [Vicingaceae bacterium]|nr:endonuclease [Vicingaceae bacterium]
MKNLKSKILFGAAFFISGSMFAQQPYYNGVNFSLTGAALKTELSNKITNTHTNQLTYSSVWTELKITDLDPTNSNNVLLLYGYNDTDGSLINDRTRNKNSNGGNNGEWNREHTFAQSLATPNMTTSSPNAGTDAHHLRSSDVQMNGNRGNRKFASGSGDAGNVGSNWYPGDEWKGDVARMMMYMYLRYPSQCKPTGVGTGSTVALDDMLTLFIQWNVDDPVSSFEQQRNTRLETSQGNRNPFIDNPYLATIIWGGTAAEDFWPNLSVSEKGIESSFLVYPTPSNDGNIHVFFDSSEEVKSISVYNVSGQQLRTEYSPIFLNNEFLIKGLPEGIFILKALIGDEVLTKKVVVN